MDPSILIIFSRSYIFMLVVIWAYLFVYSHRKNIDLPLGFGIVIAGSLVAGHAVNIPSSEYKVVNLSISLPFLVALLGLLWNITNIREQLYVGTLKELLRLTGVGIISGLFLGFCSVAVFGFGYFQDNDQFTSTALITSVMQISIAEEILSRGCFLSYLRKYGFTPVFAIVFQSLMFTIAHIPRYFDNWMALVINFSIGVIAGYLTWKTKNLIPAIILHILSNLVGIVWWLAVV